MTENRILNTIFENRGREMTPTQIHNYMKKKEARDIKKENRYFSLTDKAMDEESAREYLAYEQ